MMAFDTYKKYWDKQAATPESALAAVDGSASEAVVQLTGQFTADLMRVALDLQSQDRILELGCGVGRIGRELAARCAHWVGVDISQRMLDHAAERLVHLDNIELHQLQRTALDQIADGALNKAYSVAVLCHMDKEDLYLYLQELKRITLPKGMIYVETWNLDHPVGWKRWEYEVENWRHSDQAQRKNVSRNQFCAPQEFRLYLQHAGFDVLACHADSPWIQVVATHGYSEQENAAHSERLENQAQQIAYSPLFSELFDQTVAVIYGKQHPREVVEFLDRNSDQPEAPLFRPFILSMWRNSPQRWGECDRD